MKRKSRLGQLISTGAIVTMAMVCTATLAVAEQPAADSAARKHFESIVGSWKVVDDSTGDVFFGTYNGNPFRGTVNFTSPNDFTSLTHGAWRRTGPRTFADTDSGFIYDDDGAAILIITFRAEVEVDPGGDTASFDFAFEVTEFDGTVVDSGASTATGTRIKVQPL